MEGKLESQSKTGVQEQSVNKITVGRLSDRRRDRELMLLVWNLDNSQGHHGRKTLSHPNIDGLLMLGRKLIATPGWGARTRIQDRGEAGFECHSFYWIELMTQRPVNSEIRDLRTVSISVLTTFKAIEARKKFGIAIM